MFMPNMALAVFPRSINGFGITTIHGAAFFYTRLSFAHGVNDQCSGLFLSLLLCQVSLFFRLVKSKKPVHSNVQALALRRRGREA
jgi:hypothetical protein